jgi:osmotically-inducible protein OsmY
MARQGKRGWGAAGKVILSGNVHSWFERNEARQAAWAAPGVKEVDDRIAVMP